MIGSDSSRARWRAAPPGDCVWACWDGEYVLYHRPSGKTHFVNAATALLLKQVLREPRDAETASQLLAEAQGSGDAAAMVTYVVQLLQRFEQLGLVERATT